MTAADQTIAPLDGRKAPQACRRYLGSAAPMQARWAALDIAVMSDEAVLALLDEPELALANTTISTPQKQHAHPTTSMQSAHT